MKVFTAFSGYDSQCMALDRLHSNFNKFNYELVGWSEIDKYAIQAHNIIYPQYKDRNYGDISKINWDKVEDFDLLTYSSPCTDFSVAGLQKGGEKGSGTRSSLLWECERAIKEKKPKYLLMENVAALVSNKFIKLFNKWQSTLESYGYTNYAKVLNAKDFEVPQNRERIFMVSVRNDVKDRFYFPQPFKSNIRLKDILEDKVDEKYYLSEKSYKNITINKTYKGCTDRTLCLNSKVNGKQPSLSERIYNVDGISTAVTTSFRPNITEHKVILAGNINPSGNGMNGNVFDSNGLSPTLTTNKGEDNKILEPKVKQIGNIIDDTNIGFKNPQIGRIYDVSGICPALNCCQGGNHEPKILQRPRGFNKGGIYNICPSIGYNSWQENNFLNADFRIRKLTPKESFRLMDVSEDNIDKLMNSGISNSQLYKLAGNSIVVNCLYHIFRKLFVEKENDSKQLELF
jgi:DNA (cytosine-5)-methyltransferase 1